MIMGMFILTQQNVLQRKRTDFLVPALKHVGAQIDIIRYAVGCGRIASILIVLLCAIDVSASEGTSKTECLWIDDAKIVASNNSEMKEFGSANRGHQIGPGRRKVIAVRRFDDPQLGPDSGIFRKTTMELDNLPFGMKLDRDYEVRVIDSFHSEGSFAFVKKGAYDWVARPLQSVRIKREVDGLRLHYSQNVIGEHAATKSKKHLTLKVDCALRKMRVGDLSLWQGFQGTNFQSFYPPAAGPL